MRDFLLFIDTETSGLPKDWNEPYSKAGNWPCIVQIAWIVYTKEGKEIKNENHFIQAHDFEITATARRIHGITREFLLKNGESRISVMQSLFADLQKYQPLVIGYFMQLDFHMLGVGFYRSGLDNPLKALPTFCTMKATGLYAHYPHRKYLGLGELYKKLFHAPLQHQHDAVVDARATARCFFALLEKGDINEDTIEQQQIVEDKVKMTDKSMKLIFLMLFILLFIILTLYLL